MRRSMTSTRKTTTTTSTSTTTMTSTTTAVMPTKVMTMGMETPISSEPMCAATYKSATPRTIA